MFGFRMRDVAFLATPLTRVDFHDFFVAVFGEAGRVGDGFLSDVDDGGAGGEVVGGFFVHAELLVFDLQDGFGGFGGAAGGGADAGHVGVGGEGVVAALGVVPSFEFVGVVDVWVDGHASGGEEGEGAAAEIGDFDTFEGDDGVGHGVEVGGCVAPDGETDGVACLVDKGEFALVVGFGRAAGGDLGGFGDGLEDPNGVDGGVFFNVLKVGDGGEVESDLGDAVTFFRL